MSYKLKFFESAYREWQKLDPYVQKQFKLQLRKRLQNPHVTSAKLKGHSNLYKIKLRSIGYRLAYLVEEEEISIYVICVALRDKIYEILPQRLDK
jgi:mRNA interferase RelE/StbE